MNIFKHSKNVNAELDHVIFKIQDKLLDKGLSPWKRKMLEKDVRSCLLLMKQLRDLDVMDSFYNNAPEVHNLKI